MLKKHWSTYLLLGLLVWVQAQIWFGRGSLTEMRRMQAQVQAQLTENEAMKISNQQIAAEVLDLQYGVESLEELARMEVGMIKRGEIFVQTKD